MKKLTLMICVLLVAILTVCVVVLVRVNALADAQANRPVEVVKAWRVTEVGPSQDVPGGLRQGDIIIAVDGKQCRTAIALANALPGSLRLIRDGKQFIVDVSEAELGGKVEPVSLGMLREAAPL